MPSLSFLLESNMFGSERVPTLKPLKAYTYPVTSFIFGFLDVFPFPIALSVAMVEDHLTRRNGVSRP